MKVKMLITGILFTFFAVAAQAQTATPVVKERQENQQERIGQGVNSGELTAREAARLERQQARVNRSKKAAKADGEVTAGERARIHHQQNKASRNVYRKKHNERDRN